MKNAPATSILSVRVSAQEKALLEAASENARTSLSDFIRRRAVEAAEIEYLDRRVITIPAEKWEEFEAWLNEPPRADPRLAALMRRKPTWEE